MRARRRVKERGEEMKRGGDAAEEERKRLKRLQRLERLERLEARAAGTEK